MRKKNKFGKFLDTGKLVAAGTGVLILALFAVTLNAVNVISVQGVNHTNYQATLQDSPQDRQPQQATNRSDSDPNVVGNIFEFVTDSPYAESGPDNNQAAQPAVFMEVMDPSLEQFAPLWQKEISRRFTNAVGVLCHGGEFIDNEWIVSSSSYGRLQNAETLVKHFQDKYPGRTIVLLACNPGHLHLNIPGVYHATDSVWCVPDREVMSHTENALAKL